MGLVLLCVIWLITLASTYFFVAKTWWLPTGASAAAAAIDHQFAVTFVIMGVIFVAAQMALGYLVFKYRDGANAGRPVYSHGNTTLEVVWTTLTVILFVGLNLIGEPIWASERWRPAVDDATRVEVTGMKFAWYFRYPGPDGKFGTTRPELEDPSSGGETALGLDPKDPASKDDIATGIMEMPVKQATVPRLAIHMHFTPTETGSYEILCAELCGLGHYKMHGILKVVTQSEFDQWIKEHEADKQ